VRPAPVFDVPVMVRFSDKILEVTASELELQHPLPAFFLCLLF